MGRPPTHGAPSFRFHPSEVAHMEAILREHAGHVPPRELLVALAEKFSNSPERSGKITVQMKQVWNWFQNRRYALRSKLVKTPGNSNMPPNLQGEVAPVRNVPTVPQQTPVPSGHNVVRNTSENPPMEFEAKSARDGAWYDVQAFLSHRYLETGNPEVLIRFAGFGQEEDEWVNVRKHVRQRSLPCESSECIVVLPGDLILCFQEGKEQALYFDAHVLDAQRRRHDVRGCRCRFLVRYDHDQSEEIVPLRKVCRRPETDYRLQVLQTANESASASASVSGDSKNPAVEPVSSTTLRMSNPNPSVSVAYTSPTMNPAADFPAPPIASAPGTALAPTPAGILTPSSTPISASDPSLTPISAPTPTPTPTPVSAQTPSSTPSSTIAPVSAPTLTTVAAPNTSMIQISAPTANSIPTLFSGPSPVSAPTSSPPLLSPAPSPAPDPIQSSVSVVAPELKKIESDKPATLAGENSAQENIINPGTASIVVEAKKEESSIQETSTVAGSSISQGEMSDNHAVTIISPQKPEDIAPSEPITEVSAAAKETGPILSKGLPASSENTKE